MCKTSKKILLRLGPSTKFGNAAAIALVLVGLCRRRHFGAHFCHSKWPKIPPMGLKMGHKWPRMTESSGKTPFSQSWWFVWWHFERTHGVFLENPIFVLFKPLLGTFWGLFGAVLGLFWGQSTPLTAEKHAKPDHTASRTLPKRIPSHDTAIKAPVVHVLGPSRGHLGPFWGHFAAKYHR